MIARVGTFVGRAIASVVNLLDLPLAVVSGSVALGYGEPFFEAAQAEMDLRCRLDSPRGARVVPGGLGDAGPLVGAARVGLHGVERRDERGGCRAAGRTTASGGAETAWWWPGPWRRTHACGGLRSAHCGGWHGAGGGGAPPFLPVPGESYWRFRLVTAEGGDGTSEALEAADVVAYLRWCQRSRPRRG